MAKFLNTIKDKAAKIKEKAGEAIDKINTSPTYAEMAATPTTDVQASDGSGTIKNKISAGLQNIGSALGFDKVTQNGNAPEASAPNAQPSTYLDYYNNLPDKLKELYTEQINSIDERNAETIKGIEQSRDDALSYAENAKANAYEQADINRESDMINAANAYERAKTGYGAKAEALASKGLVGSGYSDYLEAQAYAANRADVQSAIAREAEAKRLADNQYDEMSYAANAEANKLITEQNQKAAENKATAEFEKDKAILEAQQGATSYKEGIFNDILAKVQNGTYTQEEAVNLAKLYGIEGDQLKSITNSVNAYKTKQTEAEYNAIIDNISADPDYYTESQLNKMAEDGRITKDQLQASKNHIKEVKKDNLLTSAKQYIDSGDVTSAVTTLDGGYSNGTIGKNEYQEGYFNIGLSNYGSIKAGQLPDAIEDIDSLVEEGKLSKADGESLKKYAFEKSGGKVASFSSVKYEDEKDKITIGNITYENVHTYSASPAVDKALKSTFGKSPGTVVIYGDKVYAYLKGEGWVKIFCEEDTKLSNQIKKYSTETKIPTHSK